MVEAILLSEHLELDTDIQKDHDDSFSVLHWQCRGRLNAGNALSPKNINQEAYDFLLLARRTNASLVLTPEYSFPWECLDQLLDNPTLQPAQGKLWCLCMQYLSLSEFEQWLDVHKSESLDAPQYGAGRRIIWDGFSVHKEFVNILAYIFKDMNGELVVLLQSKLFHMRDLGFHSEASGLSLGRRIYLFDKSNHDIRVFCSMICADALDHRFYEAIGQKLHGRKLLVFHPQLNSDPYFGGIMRYVDVYIDKQWSFLRLNWAFDTELSGLPLRKPGTGYIYKADRNVESFWNSPSDRQHYIQNRSKGLHLLMNESRRAHWLFPSEPHAARYHLRHPKPTANAAQTSHELTVGELYYYEAGVGWQSCCSCPWTKFLKAIESRGPEVSAFLERIHCARCKGGTCALFMADRFISMLRGIRDHDVIFEIPSDSYGNGCVTNIACDLLFKAQEDWERADMIGAYLRDICRKAETSSDTNLQTLRHIVPEGVRIEVVREIVQNRSSMYNVVGLGTGRLQKGLAIYTEATNSRDLDRLQDEYGRLTTVEDLGVMLFYPVQQGTVSLYPNTRWGQVPDIGPSGTTPKSKSDIGLRGN